MNKLILILLSFILTTATWAEGSYWQCTTVDNQEKQWVAKNPYDRVAINKAYDACKKQSTNPSSCKSSKENCEYFSDGMSTRPAWRCTALDQMSKPWPSNLHTNRDDAALEAKAYCQQHSGMPDSCYINLLTCNNLNERS
jgi:hypothetical protein